MLTKITAALAAALIAGSASVALASENSGDYSGGFVVPGSTDGVNPAYHRDLSPRTANGAKAFGLAPTVNRPIVHQQESGSYR